MNKTNRITAFFLAVAMIIMIVPTAKMAVSAEDTYLPTTIQNHNSHTYGVYELSMTWHEAKAYCESLGGHLATITSQKEQIFLQNLIKDGTKKQYWLGATDEVTEGIWKWVTGEAWGYTNWGRNEPNNYRDIEHYLQMYRLPNPVVWEENALGKWNDIDVNNYIADEDDFFAPDFIGFICEWEYLFSQNDSILALTSDDITLTVAPTCEIGKDILVTATVRSSNHMETYFQLRESDKQEDLKNAALGTSKEKFTGKGFSYSFNTSNLTVGKTYYIWAISTFGDGKFATSAKTATMPVKIIQSSENNVNTPTPLPAPPPKLTEFVSIRELANREGIDIYWDSETMTAVLDTGLRYTVGVDGTYIGEDGKMYVKMPISGKYIDLIFSPSSVREDWVSWVVYVATGLIAYYTGGKWLIEKAGEEIIKKLAPTIPLIQELSEQIEEWLGEGAKAIINKSGDLILLSQDGLRRVRFDIINPKPHVYMHMHIEELIDDVWWKSGPLFPIDVPHF